MLELESQIKMKRCVFIRFLKMAMDSAAQIELSRSHHEEGTFNLKVCESDFVCLFGMAQ